MVCVKKTSSSKQRELKSAQIKLVRVRQFVLQISSCINSSLPAICNLHHQYLCPLSNFWYQQNSQIELNIMINVKIDCNINRFSDVHNIQIFNNYFN